jgi:thiol-disulfide isomerase/thioredoxin/uncharacterized RDD family membrane protein YckC
MFYFHSLALFVLCCIPGLLYKPFMESYYGATLGKMALHIEVVGENGERLDLRRAYLRFSPFLVTTLIGELAAIWILSNAPLATVSGLGAWSQFVAANPTPLSSIHSVVNLLVGLECVAAAFTYRKRAGHDFLAKSYCVHKFEKVSANTGTSQASPDISMSTGSEGPSPAWSAVTVMSILVAIGLLTAVVLKTLKPPPPDLDAYITIDNITVKKPPRATRVLFLGNSHTYTHQIPRMLSQMVPEGQEPIWFQSRAAPNTTINWFWQRDDILRLITREKREFIVLQPDHLEPVQDPEKFRQQVRKFESLSVHNGAQLLVWAPWARDAKTDTDNVHKKTWTGGTEESLTERLNQSVEDATDRSISCPIGKAWLAVRQETPEIVLHSPKDGNQATLSGAYLTALTLYGCLYRDPATVTWAPEKITPDSATKLRSVVTRVLEENSAAKEEDTDGRAADNDTGIIAKKGPDFSLRDLSGKTHDLDDLSGKPTLLYFWAPWCAPCKKQSKVLTKFHKDNRKNIDVVGVAISYSSKKSVRKYVRREKLPYLNLLGTESVSKSYKIGVLPSFVLLDAAGIVLNTNRGTLPRRHLNSFIKESAGRD